MADGKAAQTGENTPEQVAYKLMRDIAAIEGRLISGPGTDPKEGEQRADRKWLLDTYAECLTAIKHPSSRIGGGSVGRVRS